MGARLVRGDDRSAVHPDRMVLAPEEAPAGYRLAQILLTQAAFDQSRRKNEAMTAFHASAGLRGACPVALRADHLPQALELSSALDWPYRLEDWEFALSL